MKAFKFIARETHVPEIGIYSGCATVAIADSLESAREEIHSWGAQQSPPDDTKWIDFAEVREMDLVPGVLIFVMQ